MVNVRFLNTSFLILTLLAVAALILAWQREGALFSSIILTAALLIAFYSWSRYSEASPTAVMAGQALILLHLAGVAFNLYPQSFAGVTYDTYMHLLAGFAAMMLVVEFLKNWVKSEQRVILYGAGVVLFLGVGVEVVELINLILLGDALCQGWCPYWQDTVKDFINDGLGILLYIIARKR